MAALSLVYIAEAHSSDQWPLGPTLSYPTAPKVLEERMKLAADALGRLDGGGLPMLVDLIDDSFLDAYAAWPIRFFVIDDGRVEYIAQPREQECLYFTEDLVSWLEAYHGGM